MAKSSLGGDTFSLVYQLNIYIYIFLSFIDHSFEERRKILKGKKGEGSIINVKGTAMQIEK